MLIFPVTQDAVTTYKETRNGLIGVDYSTKFSPWWVILSFCEQGLIFHISQFYRDISDGLIVQVGTGLHFTQVYLSSEQAIWERANSQSEHILVSLGSQRLIVMVLLSLWSTPICRLLSIIRVIFELLWRDYFKFVAVKYGNKLFQVKGKISTSFLTQWKCVNLKGLCFRSSGQVCLLEKGHEDFQRMERLVTFSHLSSLFVK